MCIFIGVLQQINGQCPHSPQSGFMAYGVEGCLEVHEAAVDCSTFPFRLLCYQSECNHTPVFPKLACSSASVLLGPVVLSGLSLSAAQCGSSKHTHTQQPFYGFMDIVWEETFTHSHLSWSSIVPYLLHLSTTIHGILLVQSMYLTVFFTISLQVFFGLPLGLAPYTSYSIHFFTQSLSSFRNTCPYHHNLFCYSTEIMSSNPSL